MSSGSESQTGARETATTPSVTNAFVLFRPYVWLLVLACALGSISTVLFKVHQGPSYTATALIQPDLREPSASGLTPAPPLVDAKMVIESQVKLLKSHSLARQVVERLNTAGGRAANEIAAPGSVLRDVAASIPFFSNLSGPGPTALDAKASSLIRLLSIGYSRQTYLIEVSYTSSSPAAAATIVNAVAGEFVKFHRLRERSYRHSNAKERLAQLSRQYGSGHPLVISAKADVASALAEVQEIERSTALLTAEDLSATGLIVPAQSSTVPSGNYRAAAMIGVVMGVVVTLALFFMRERKKIFTLLKAG